MIRRPLEATPQYTPSGRHYRYRMVLEPHQQHWLPALDYPSGPIEGVRFSYDYQSQTTRPVTARTAIDLEARPETRPGLDENPQILSEALRLPRTGNPRAHRLAARLRADTPEASIAAILAWFSDGDFVYTLQPPLLDYNSIDFFLFDTRQGFCEHYAGAFVFLARATGVPARVVTGYQGGKINREGIFTVRQSDAHAWAEVWFATRGWVRVDPTGLVSPQRIDGGLSDALSDGLPFMLRPENAWMRGLRDRWEALASRWNEVVIGFDAREQQKFFANLGFEYFSKAKALGWIALVCAAFLLAFYYLAQRRPNDSDPLDRAWARFSVRMARRGLARKPSEGPFDYAHRLAIACPRQATTLKAICADYAYLRYRPPVSDTRLARLIHTINTLKL